jgi:thymidylate synthase (FAD)
LRVELLDTMGDDLAIVNAARVSYANESSSMGSRERGLIGYLMRNKHGSPFEMVEFKFRVSCPIAVAREWMRHRIASYNEVSTRYVELPEEFYIPSSGDMRTRVGSPGHYTYEPMNAGDADAAKGDFQYAYSVAWDIYQKMVKRGDALEQARNVLPLGVYTQFIFKVNLRSLMNFLSLRLHSTALLEIRQCSQLVYKLAEPIAPHAFNAWERGNRPSGEDMHDCDACDYHIA